MTPSLAHGPPRAASRSSSSSSTGAKAAVPHSYAMTGLSASSRSKPSCVRDQASRPTSLRNCAQLACRCTSSAAAISAGRRPPRRAPLSKRDGRLRLTPEPPAFSVALTRAPGAWSPRHPSVTPAIRPGKGRGDGPGRRNHIPKVDDKRGAAASRWLQLPGAFTMPQPCLALILKRRI